MAPVAELMLVWPLMIVLLPFPTALLPDSGNEPLVADRVVSEKP